MPIVTVRPDGTISPGVWNVVGPPGTLPHQALNDDNDLTWLEVPGGKAVLTDGEIAKFSIQDFDVPDNAKIFAVRTRVRVQKIQGTPDNPNPPQPRPGCGFHRHGFLFDLIRFIFRILFSFLCPRKPPPPGSNPGDPPTPPEWATVELSYYTEQPGGGEWTEQSFTDFFVSLFRADAEATALRIGEIWVDLDYNEAPQVTVTGPVGPLVDITLPTVTWDYIDPESDKQLQYWVRIFTEDVYTGSEFDPETSVPFDESGVPDNGWLIGEDTFWTTTRDHPNGAYRAYVKARQVWGGIGTHESAWAYHQWLQDVPGPPQPTLTATYEPTLHRVRLDLHEGGPTPATDTYDIFCSDNLGVTWDLVRDGSKVDIDDQRDSLIYDYEAPSNRVRLYRASAFRILNSILVTSGYSNEAQATPRSDKWWLKDIVMPALNMTLNVHDLQQSYPAGVGVYEPLMATDESGRESRAVVVSGPVSGVRAKMVMTFRGAIDGTEPAWDNFHQLRKTRRTLLLQYPTGEQHFINLLGDLDGGKWAIRNNRVKFRQPSISWVEVDEPPVTVVRKKPGLI